MQQMTSVTKGVFRNKNYVPRRCLPLPQGLDYFQIFSSPKPHDQSKLSCSMTFCFSFEVLIKLNPIQMNIKGGGSS